MKCRSRQASISRLRRLQRDLLNRGGIRVDPFADFGDPLRKPFQRNIFGQRTTAGVVLEYRSIPRCAQGRQDLVEMLTAKAERPDVRAVAQCKDAIAKMRKVRPGFHQVRVQSLGVVRDVAMTVRRCAYQENAGWREHAMVEPVHERDLYREAFIAEREL